MRRTERRCFKGLRKCRNGENMSTVQIACQLGIAATAETRAREGEKARASDASSAGCCPADLCAAAASGTRPSPGASTAVVAAFIVAQKRL